LELIVHSARADGQGLRSRRLGRQSASGPVEDARNSSSTPPSATFCRLDPERNAEPGSQATVPLLRASRHPRIVNVSSGAGSHGDHAFGLGERHGAAASYGISKAALNALTYTLAAAGAEAMGARSISVTGGAIRRRSVTFAAAEACA
jgi:hypothetical protein